MDHFLITRFNLKVKDWTQTRDGHEVNQTDWLEHRYELFERFCWPSIVGQSNQDFQWLVFFDIDTPEKFRSRNDELALAYRNFKPLYINGVNEFLPALVDMVKSLATHEHIITSRIDNDDLVHEHFISEVKRFARPAEELIIDFENGYQLIQINKRYEVRNYTHYFNPFLSLVESASDIKTVMRKNHRDWKSAKMIVKPGGRFWIEHIHSRNKLNSARLSLTLSGKKDWSDFGIGQALSLPSFTQILITNLTIKLSRLKVKMRRVFVGK